MEVAIVMMVRDQEEFLPQAIGSLLSQTYTDWHLFVADSSEPSSVVLQNFQKLVPDKITVKRDTPATGPAHGFNMALGMAKGEGCGYIARLDGDDFYVTDGLEQLVDALERADEDIMMVYGNQLDLTQVKGRWRATRVSHVADFESVTAGRFIRGPNTISGGAILARAELYDAVGGWKEDMLGAWDMEWYIRAMARGFKFQRTQRPIYYHRILDTSMFAESQKGGDESRYKKWRKQLWGRRKEYREESLRNMFVPTKISITLPTTGTLKLLKNCVDSILSQSYRDFELVVVADAGRHDRVKEYMELYQDTRVRVMGCDVKSSIVATNIGMEAMNADIWMRMDDDDTMEPHALWQIISAFQANSGIGFVYGDYYLKYEGVERHLSESPEFPEVRAAITTVNHIPSNTLAVRGCVIEKVGYMDEVVDGNTDYDHAIRIIKQHNIVGVRIPYPLYTCNVRSKGKSADTIRNKKSMAIIKRRIAEGYYEM